MDSHPRRVLTYAIAASIVVGFAAGVMSGFLFRPLGDWWFGGFTWIISLVISIILSILVFFKLADENLTMAPVVVGALMISVGTIIATTGILLAANIIFGVAFAIVGLRDFTWATSGLAPTESERLMGSIFTNGVTIGAVLVSIIAGILIFFFVFLMCAIVIEASIREKVPKEPLTKEKPKYVSYMSV